VESHLVQQGWADRMGGMQNGAIGRISERVTHRWNVCSTPLADAKSLRNLLGNEVSEHREFAAEVVVNPYNFLRQIGRRVVAPDEYRFAVFIEGICCREDPGREQ